MSLRTDFKDEIPAGGSREYGIVDRAGNYIQRNVRIVRTNENIQEGDGFGANEANEITGTINGIIDGTIEVRKATNATKINNVGIEDIVRESISGIGTKPPQSNDALNVSLGGTKNGFIEWISNISPHSATNLPISNFIGYKIQYSQSSNHAIVLLYEVYPNPGNIWTHAYNAGWKGWNLSAGSMDLWSGSAAAGATITLANPHSYFKALDIYIDNGYTCITVPVKRPQSGLYAGNITKGATDDFYLFSGQFDLSGTKNFVINKLGKIALKTSIYSATTVVKVVGR